MAVVLSTACTCCGKPLTDPLSRRYGIGPDCRAGMSPEQLTDALRRNQPGYVPKARPASATARATNACARQAAQAPTDADLCACGSGSLAGRCPPCNQQAREPMGFLAERVAAYIERVREQRRAARDAELAARLPQVEQLVIGGPT